jgi:hypothetical protein
MRGEKILRLWRAVFRLSRGRTEEDNAAQIERASVIVYTGLWQLRAFDPAGEPAELRAARVLLRERIDAFEGRGS